MNKTDETKQTLAAIYAALKAEKDISWGEIAFLQAHQAEIKQLYPDDPLLWQWAEIPESEWLNN